MIETRHQAKQWGMFCHLAALTGWIGIPFGWILGPLVLWLMKKDEMKFVDDQGRQAVNFQINMLIYGIVAGLLSLLVIGIPFLIAISLAMVICPIIATVEASKGNYYRYPCVLFNLV